MKRLADRPARDWRFTQRALDLATIGSVCLFALIVAAAVLGVLDGRP